jgi:hypothetical protein
MTDRARGTTYDWPAFIRDNIGELADAQSLQVEIRDDLTDTVQTGFPQDLSGTIVHDGVGMYHVPWAIPVDQELGLYYAYWTGTVDGVAVAGVDTLNVVLPGTIDASLEGPGFSYLTPERLRTLRLGVSWTNWSDLELAELIADASAEANAYCNVPLEGSFSFLGGTVTEEHTWRLPDHPYDPGQTRIYPRVANVISVDEVQLQLSANTYQTIPASSFVVNNLEGWVELSALVLAPGIFGISFFIFPLAALERPMVRLGVTYGKTWEHANERLYPIAEGSRTYQAPDGFWTAAAPELAGAGVSVSPDDYTIDRASGQVTFAEGAVPDAPVTANYVTRLDRDVARATGLICGFMANRTTGPSKLLIGGATSIKAGEISISRNVPGRSLREGSVIEDLAHDVPGAARLLNGHRFMRIA